MPRDMIEEPRKEGARDLWRAMWHGFVSRCPSCGEGRLFRKYLKVTDECPTCGEALHHQRADDAPAYFTITLVGHVVVGGVLWLERAYTPAIWVHWAIWLPFTFVASLLLLPRIKGALVGLQWAFRMHGFGEKTDKLDAPPLVEPTLGDR